VEIVIFSSISDKIEVKTCYIHFFGVCIWRVATRQLSREIRNA